MADVMKTSKNLKIIAEFGDGTEQFFTQEDPTSENLANKINAFGNFAVTNNLFVSEKSNATISRIRSATIIETSETDFDLG